MPSMTSIIWAWVVLYSRPMGEAHPVAGSKGLQALSRQLAVGDADHGAVEGPEAGRADSDLLHRAHEVLDLDEVADAEGLVHGKGDRAEQVFDALLGAEGERQGARPEQRVEPGPDQQLADVAVGGWSYQRLIRRTVAGEKAQ